MIIIIVLSPIIFKTAKYLNNLSHLFCNKNHKYNKYNSLIKFSEFETQIIADF